MFKDIKNNLINEKKDKESLKLQRIILLAIPYFYFVFGLFFYNAANINDPMSLSQRGFIIFIFLSLFILSFISSWVEKSLENLVYIASYFAIMHLAYVAYLNSYDYAITISLIVSAAIANLFFDGNRLMLYLNTVTSLFVGGTLLFSEETIIFKISYFTAYLSVVSFTYFISHQKFKTKNRFDTVKEEQEILLNNTDIQIWYLKDFDKYGKVNQAHADFLGVKKEELSNKKLDQFLDPEEAKTCKKGNKEVFEEKRKVESKEWVKNNNDEIRCLSITKIPKVNGNDSVEFVVCSAYDITDRIEKEAEIKHLLFKDALTDLYNRRFFEEEIERLDTKRQLPISIIMTDVNGLKIINDTYGHEKGDEMLIKAANLLKDSLREEDILARHGGDEFAILLPQTNKELAEKILNRIKNAAKKTEAEEIPISISFGVATKSKKTEDINDILKQADDAMYQNKLLESKSVKNKIIENLLSTLSVKSSETKNHALRMTGLAHDLGKNQGLPVSELDRLSLLSLLHDIGKATISEEILTKPGKLTDEEWKIIKKHPETGSRIASASNEFALVAEEILSHHERWDGKGYPRGLKGEKIPYLARIIAVVDTYDVMTNDRPYSKAVSKKEALAEIKKCSGSQFDPELAKGFIEMM